MVTVGSSDVASILGLSPWAGPHETWARLTGLVPRYNRKTTKEMEAGNIFEVGMRAEYGRRFGCEVVPGPPLAEAPFLAEDGWRHARPDGIAVRDGRLVLVECKKTRDWEGWGPEGTDEVPPYYLTQTAWQNAVPVPGVGFAERVDLIAYSPMDDGVRVYHMPRDLSLEAELVEIVRAWMARHVWAPDAPPPEGVPPMAHLAQIHRRGGHGEWLDATDADAALVAEYRALDAETREHGARMEAIKAALCHRIRDAAGVRGLVRWSPVKPRETVSASALCKAYPDIYRELVRVGEPTRRFSLIEDRRP